MNRIFFIHIEKAAGTSFHTFLQKKLFLYHVLEPVPYDSELKYTSKKVDHRVIDFLGKFLGVRHFGGHCLGIHNIEKLMIEDLSVLTLLREPVSRTISHFRYQCEVMGIDWSIDDFLEQAEFHDFMCRKICGVPSSQMAIEAVEKKRVTAGLIEHFGVSIAHFKNNSCAPWTLGDVNLDVQNARSSRESIAARVTDEELDKINHVNREDQKLYDYILEKLENDASIETHPADPHFLNGIRSKILYFVNRAYSALIVRQIERLLRRKYPDVSTSM